MAGKKNEKKQDRTTPSRDERYSCLFPGVLRVLDPERSFVPLNLAVRVLNLSSGGSLVEIHGASFERPLESLQGLYFELRIAAGSKFPMYGRVARTDASEATTLLGLMFHKSYPELIGELIHSSTTDLENDNSLPVPVIDPFSPLCDDPVLTLSGQAYDADEVVVEDEDGKVHATRVEEGTFRARVELAHPGHNVFRLYSRKGEARSSSTPISIHFVPPTAEGFSFNINESEDPSGKIVVTCTYLGPGMPPEALVEAIRDAAQGCSTVRMTLRLKSDEVIAREKLDTILERAEAETNPGGM